MVTSSILSVIPSVNNNATYDSNVQLEKFIADFYKYAFVGLMLEWIKDGMKTPPERIISRLADLIDGDVVRMLNKCRLDPSGSTS